eukprot:1143942-Pelagomonas_calceolata.AAC.13
MLLTCEAYFIHLIFLALALRCHTKVRVGPDQLPMMRAHPHQACTQVRAGPDELPVVAAELSRALLFCRVPEWAEVEAQRCVLELRSCKSVRVGGGGGIESAQGGGSRGTEPSVCSAAFYGWFGCVQLLCGLGSCVYGCCAWQNSLVHEQ